MASNRAQRALSLLVPGHINGWPQIACYETLAMAGNTWSNRINEWPILCLTSKNSNQSLPLTFFCIVSTILNTCVCFSIQMNIDTRKCVLNAPFYFKLFFLLLWKWAFCSIATIGCTFYVIFNLKKIFIFHYKLYVCQKCHRCKKKLQYDDVILVFLFCDLIYSEHIQLHLSIHHIFIWRIFYCLK